MIKAVHLDLQELNWKETQPPPSAFNYPATWPHVKKTHASTLRMMSFYAWTVKMVIMHIVHFGKQN